MQFIVKDTKYSSTNTDTYFGKNLKYVFEYLAKKVSDTSKKVFIDTFKYIQIFFIIL